MWKLSLDEVTSIVAIALLVVIASITVNAVIKESPQYETFYLVDELTTTPGRQQKALDRLALYSNEDLKCLIPYFNDERPIASQEVKFLNTGSLTWEKYFLTGGEKVSQILIQYFCWRTMQCVVSSTTDMEKVKRQIESDFEKERLVVTPKDMPRLVKSCTHP